MRGCRMGSRGFKSIGLLACLTVLVTASLVVLCNDEKGAKVSTLFEKAKLDKSHVVRFNTVDEYMRFVSRQPRPYHLFIFFSAPVDYCSHCKEVEKHFSEISRSFFLAGAYKKEEKLLPTFFAVVNLVQMYEIGVMHDIQHVPVVAHTDSTTFKRSGAAKRFPKASLVRFDLSMLDRFTTDFMQFANDRSGREVELSFTFFEKVAKLLSILASLGIPGACGVLLLLLVHKYPVFIVIGGLVIQLFSTCGFFFNLSHGMRWTGFDRAGNVIRVSPETRAQFLGEGVTMSAAIVLAGILLVGATMTTASERLRKKKLVTLFTWLQLAGCCALVFLVFNVYKYKSPWYDPFFFPKQGRRGPLHLDQGNSF